jgi:lysophospholipase L1-like esterase
MQRFCLLSGACALVVLACSAVPAAEKLSLKKGDTIIFLGDSITQGGEGPTGYVGLIRKHLAAKHKELGVKVINAGISGHKVPDLEKRLKRDVLDKKPTLVVIYIGINDVWHGESDPKRGTSKERFESGLKDIIGQIQKAGARVLLCTPSVIGEKKKGGNKLDRKLDEYSAVSRKVARDKKVPLCDLRKAFVGHLAKHNKDNKERGVLTRDRVHLNDAGNKLVARTILDCLGE